MFVSIWWSTVCPALRLAILHIPSRAGYVEGLYLYLNIAFGRSNLKRPTAFCYGVFIFSCLRITLPVTLQILGNPDGLNNFYSLELPEPNLSPRVKILHRGHSGPYRESRNCHRRQHRGWKRNNQGKWIALFMNTTSTLQHRHSLNAMPKYIWLLGQEKKPRLPSIIWSNGLAKKLFF